jgi:hypothetical protein
VFAFVKDFEMDLFHLIPSLGEWQAQDQLISKRLAFEFG